MILLTSIGLCLFSALVDATPQVMIGGTTVNGVTYTESGVDFFGGIPFAEPPLGALRFKPPVLTTSLMGSSFDAVSFGPACLQTDLPPGFPLSEDCLQLNVFRPSGISATANLPIMFWIYGGGFTTGMTSAYNGTELVAKSIARGTPVIYVNVNYRLGPLGFPQGAEAGSKSLTNLGLKDMVAGLQWLQANIAAFGGDKTKVTIFGESAGATAVFTLLLGNKIQGLARAGIMESTGFLPVWGPERSQATWEEFVAAVPGCAVVANSTNTINCLQSVDTDAIMQGLSVIVPPDSGTSDVTFFPNIDGPGGFLPDVPAKLWPGFSRVPIIIGNNRDEGTLFVPQSTNSVDQIVAQIVAFSSPSLSGPTPPALSAAINELLVLYPDVPALGSPFGTGNATFGLDSEVKRFSALYGDFVFQASRRSMSLNLSAIGINVFGYEFTDSDAAVMVPPGITIAPGSLGVTHSSEISYVYGAPFATTPASLMLSSTIEDYWISFAVILDPNDGKGNPRPHWSQYTALTPNIMQLDGQGVQAIPDTYRAAQMSFITGNTPIFHF